MAGRDRLSVGCVVLALACLVGWVPAGWADDLLTKITIDRKVVRALGSERPTARIHVSLILQNISDLPRTVELSETHEFRLEQASDLDPNNPFLPRVADGVLPATFGQFWESIYLPPHTETVLAVGTLPDDVTMWHTDDERVPAGTYVLMVQLPPGLKPPGDAFPGWTMTTLVVKGQPSGAQGIRSK